MAYDCFDTPHIQRFFTFASRPLAEEGARNSFGFIAISCRSPRSWHEWSDDSQSRQVSVVRTVSFKVLAPGLFQGKIETGSAIGITNEHCLSFVTRHRNSSGFAVLVDTGLADNTFDGITITEGLTESLENDAGHTFLCD